MRHYIYMLFILLCGVFASCKDDVLPSRTKMRVQTQIIGLSETEGTTIRTIISGDVSLADIDCVEFQYSKHESMQDAQTIVLAQGEFADTIISQIPVSAGETYYFKYNLGNEISRYTTSIDHFTVGLNFAISNFWLEQKEIPIDKCTGASGFAIDGKGYLACGFTKGGVKTNHLYEYNPDSDSWQRKADYPLAEGVDMAATFVIDGKAYIAGGMSKEYYSIKMYAYDPKADKWSECAQFPANGRSGAATFVIGKKAYLVGGYANKLGQVDEVWCYDTEKNVWEERNKFPDAYTGMYSFKIGNTVFVGGGYNARREFNPEIYIYDELNDAWSPINIEFVPSVAYAVAFSGDNCAYLAGGNYNEKTDFNVANHFYRFNGSSWEDLGGVGSDVRAKAAGFMLGDKLYVATGENSLYQPQNTLLSYKIEK